MRIISLRKSDTVYSCNSYMILGDWNRLEDVNTIIDPGTDGFILRELALLSTGFGKRPVEQVILTHNHFDHASAVTLLKKRYNPKVYAFVDGPGVDERLHDGQWIAAGDDFLEVIHTPGHSSDSICLYAPSVKALFSGDTSFSRTEADWRGEPEYMDGMRKVAGRRVAAIYSGHDGPVRLGGWETFAHGMRMMLRDESMMVSCQG
ncbi:MAG: MBL fold metallo-hydrolase [Thermodesulfobacteriota bacterium]